MQCKILAFITVPTGNQGGLTQLLSSCSHRLSVTGAHIFPLHSVLRAYRIAHVSPLCVCSSSYQYGIQISDNHGGSAKLTFSTSIGSQSSCATLVAMTYQYYHNEMATHPLVTISFPLRRRESLLQSPNYILDLFHVNLSIPHRL